MKIHKISITPIIANTDSNRGRWGKYSLRMDWSRIPKIAFDSISKVEEMWDVQEIDGHCEVATDQRPNPWKEDDEDFFIFSCGLKNKFNAFLLNIWHQHLYARWWDSIFPVYYITYISSLLFYHTVEKYTRSICD